MNTFFEFNKTTKCHVYSKEGMIFAAKVEKSLKKLYKEAKQREFPLHEVQSIIQTSSVTAKVFIDLD